MAAGTNTSFRILTSNPLSSSRITESYKDRASRLETASLNNPWTN